MPTDEQIERLKAVIGDGFQHRLTGVEHASVVRLLFMLEHAMEWARELLTADPRRDICMILSCVGGRVGWELHLLRLAVACLQGVMVFEHVAKVLDVLAVFRDREDVIGMRLQSSLRLGPEAERQRGWLVRKVALSRHRMHFFALVARAAQALPCRVCAPVWSRLRRPRPCHTEVTVLKDELILTTFKILF